MNSQTKTFLSFHSGLGAYDKAVVVGEDGEILGEQILFLNSFGANNKSLISSNLLCHNKLFEFCFD